MQQKSDLSYAEGNGIGPPSGYNNIDQHLQNQGKLLDKQLTQNDWALVVNYGYKMYTFATLK